MCPIHSSSRYSIIDPELFVNIETDIALFQRKGFIMLASDFNARTDKANDFIAEEIGNFIPGGNIPPPNLPIRQNFDNNINDHEKQLLDLCKTCDLRILNGRSKGDTLGKFTYHSINGVSTVDYIIVSHDLFGAVEGFAVKQPNIFSDHSQILCWVKIGTLLSCNNNDFQNQNYRLSFQNSISGTKRPRQNSLLRFTPMILYLGYSSSKTQHIRFKHHRCLKWY